jgi:MFS family permease
MSFRYVVRSSGVPLVRGSASRERSERCLSLSRLTPVIQLERGNISNALTDNFLKDVGITQDQFNTGQALLYLGIILLEIPSNYLLQLLGPSIWISFQVFSFGLVATLQALQKGYSGYLASRIMLGVVECGYIPGALFVISTFYKRSELAARNSTFFLGSGLASATTGLLAYGILPLGDRFPSRHGWQWMMISR